MLMNIKGKYMIPLSAAFLVIDANAKSSYDIFSPQDEFLEQIAGGATNVFSGILNGTYKFSVSDFIKSAAGVLSESFRDAKNVIISIIAVSLMLAVFYMTGSNLFNKSDNHGNPVQVFMLSVISVWIMTIIGTCITRAEQCISAILDFMKISLPVYVGVGAFSGKVTGTLYEYVFMFFGGFLYGFILKLVIPVIGYISMLNIISSVFNMEFGKTTYKTVQSTLKTLLEILIALFAALYSLWVVAGSSVSFAGMGAVKFAVAKFVPMAGGFLSDSADGIAGAFMSIKRSTGLACAVGVLLISYVPALYIGVYVLISKILVIITSPLGVTNLTQIFKTGEESLSTLFVLIICIATMFIITVSIVLSGIF